MAEEINLNDTRELFLKLVNTRIYFGKYKGRLIADLPIEYLEWFQNKGFPDDKTGVLLQAMYEIKLNGLEYLLKPLKQKEKASSGIQTISINKK